MDERERDERFLPSRRRFLTLGVGAFVVAALPLGRAGRRARVRRTLPVMGTLAEVVVVHRDERYAQGAIDAALEELRRVEHRMTRFSPLSDVGRANLAAARHPVPVSAETAGVVEAALRWAEATDGRFDPALAGAVELWDVGRRTAPPAEAEVRRYAGRALFRHVEVARAGGAARLLYHAPEIGLDLGGIAKGHAVDRAAEALRAWGIRDALVNAGGDVYALGVSEDGEPWEIGVRSPADPRALAATLRLSDRAVATSGDYEQFFDHRGRRYHHILDPATGEPRRTGTHTLTVAADRCVDADAAATALFGSPRPHAERMLAAAAPGAGIVHLG